MKKITIKRLFELGLISKISHVKYDHANDQYVIIIFNNGLEPIIAYINGFITDDCISNTYLRVAYITPKLHNKTLEWNICFDNTEESTLTVAEILDCIL